MAGGEHGNQRHETALRRARIVELRDQGLTFPEIAEDIGISHQAAWNHYQKAMRDIPAPIIAAHAQRIEARREEQLRRIDMSREAVIAVLAARHITISNGIAVRVDGEPILDDAPVLQAVDRLVKLDDQEAKLLGLYAPTRQEVITLDAIDAEIAALTAELARDQTGAPADPA